MKDLKQIQEENRKAIICAVHGCGYEEALEKELGFGCQISYNKNSYLCLDTDNKKGHCFDGCEILFYDISIDGYKIIGKPLTLDRVLLALDDKVVKCFCGNGYLTVKCRDQPNIVNGEVSLLSPTLVFNWDLTKQTLEEQDEKTQCVINELLTKKTNNDK